MTDFVAISNKISLPNNQKILKSNLKQIIQEKFKGKGWRREVAELLNMNVNTFNGIVNQANTSKISLEKLMNIVDKLELDMSQVLADNKVIISTQGRYGLDRETKKWTNERKIELVTDYLNNNIEFMSKKYKLKAESILTYYMLFRKEIRKYE